MIRFPVATLVLCAASLLALQLFVSFSPANVSASSHPWITLRTIPGPGIPDPTGVCTGATQVAVNNCAVDAPSTCSLWCTQLGYPESRVKSCIDIGMPVSTQWCEIPGVLGTFQVQEPSSGVNVWDIFFECDCRPASPPPPSVSITSPTAGSWQKASFNVGYDALNASSCTLFTADGGAAWVDRGAIACGAGQSTPINVGAGAWCVAQGVNQCGVRITGSPLPTAQLFFYTGFQRTWTVPPGVTEITVDVRGAAGSPATVLNLPVNYTATGAPGGQGARTQATLSVTPLSTLFIYVGGEGAISSGGFNGGGNGGSSFGGFSIPNPAGGGGGASDIRIGGTSLSNRVVAAGGGGGGGSGYGGSSFAGEGGDGGDLNGLSGTDGAYVFSGGACSTADPKDAHCGRGGGGGTQSNGGMGGTGGSGAGTGSSGESGGAGAFGTGNQGGQGFTGSNNHGQAGGGGGGGYHGGGGGGGSGASSAGGVAGGGGGAGGSSFCGSGCSGATYTPGFQAGDGSITISYTPGGTAQDEEFFSIDYTRPVAAFDVPPTPAGGTDQAEDFSVQYDATDTLPNLTCTLSSSNDGQASWTDRKTGPSACGLDQTDTAKIPGWCSSGTKCAIRIQAKDQAGNLGEQVLLYNAAFVGGLVPCGREFNAVDTPWNETEECQLRHTLLLIKILVDFALWKLAPLIIVLLTIFTGAVFYFSFGGPDTLTRVRGIWRAVILGTILLLLSWLFLNFFLGILGFDINIFGRWYELTL